MKARKIYETISFKRGGDPYAKLSIGPKIVIDNWFKQWASGVDYDIDDDLNITAHGVLDLSDSDITKLPNKLTVNGNLDLENSKITELPDNLTIYGSLYLENAKIAELPDNLTVNGSLWIEYTKITKLPDNLTVTGTIYKDF